MLLVGGVEIRRHEAVLARLDACQPVAVRLVEAGGGAEGAAGHLERADQHGQHGARPAALEAAPAVVHRLTQYDCDRPEWQYTAFDLDRFADAGVLEILVRHLTNGRCRHVANVCCPLR